MDVNQMLDFFEIVIGAYVVFLAIKMKKTKKLTNNGLISKSVNLDKAPDPMGYINATFWPVVICGSVICICGIASRILANTDYYSIVQNITMYASVIVLVAFGFIVMKSQRKYLEGK